MNPTRRTFFKQMGITAAGLTIGGHTTLFSSELPSKTLDNHTITIDESDGKAKVKLSDHGGALLNPNMGWVTYFYSNLFQNYGSRLEASDAVRYFPGMNTVFLRIPWAFVEPEEGRFMWEILDTPMQRWVEHGGQAAFCITATENWMHSGTPEWVYKAGAKYYKADNYLEPDYDDPIFLEKTENFVRIMAERYDGNPNVAYVFVGHYGMWGEGHTVLSTPKHGKSWDIETQKRIIDLYCKHFKHTQLCISDDFAGHDTPGVHFPITDYALSKGVTIHDDSILVQPKPRHWYHSEMAQLFWRTLPIVVEHEHYGASVERGAWDKDLLMKAVEDYHATWLSIHWFPDEELAANRDVIERINRRIGYRLQCPEIVYPTEVTKGQPFTIESRWRNAGVAPCYKGGYPCFTLKDDKGGIVSTLVDNTFNLNSLSVEAADNTDSKPLRSTFVIAPSYSNDGVRNAFHRTCKPGTFDLYVSIGKRDGTPLYELPYNGNDGHKRFKIGQLTLKEYE
ncbi:MAG: beta-galactosidase [Dysgonamonadaceae bacterium]|jgi:hypothetical protein|nr:beta-galactosidase [Dysgonamonadaceae bacterium]